MSIHKNNDRVAVVIRNLFFLNAAIWLMIAILTITRPASWMMTHVDVRWLFGALNAANALVFLGLGLLIHRDRKLLFFLALVFLLVNIVLSMTDQFGTLDLITMLVDVALFILLIFKRRFFTGA